MNATRVALSAVLDGVTLSCEDARAVLGEVMDGAVPPALLGALLIALRVRGETTEELTGFVLAMRARVIPVEAPAGAIDTCGTGGDVHSTFNISTAAALVAAAAGAPVAKHGNRAVTSDSGSSDVIEALGLAVEQAPAEAAQALRDLGFCFLHAPAFHPGMRHAGPVRRELGVRTFFNLVGPLVNPAGVRRQLVGVAEPGAAERVAQVLLRLGVDRAFVVYGDRVDELPLDGSGVILDVSPAGIQRHKVDPTALGLGSAPTASLTGRSPTDNGRLIEGILEGRLAGPSRDVVALNAGAALVVAGLAPGLVEGVRIALETITGGRANDLLMALRARRQARVG
ncbi:MAG: anthranilate phosphoribosyltransferase [Chloroflexi bacterium]|nr:anthranilate phosphoribosyltransferase [Chloroflexota bacterium]